MSLGYYDLKNGIHYDDYDKITRYERKRSSIHIDDEWLQLYIIRLFYKDGTYKDLRAYCEDETSDALVDENEKEYFFVKRLFGRDGLIVKEQRNDFIYLGGIDKERNSKTKYSRFNKCSNGKTYQQLIDERFQKEILPILSLENVNDDFDLINMQYYFHSGAEKLDEIFQNGIRSRFGKAGQDGFCSLTSTFSMASGDYWEYRNLTDRARDYARIGRYCSIIRIPRIYRGELAKDGTMYPPLPTHKLIDYESGDSYIIPEIIYAVYDTVSKTLYKNPNYNLNYDPSGLVYDQEVADNMKFDDEQWYNFLEQRKTIPYDKLKVIDKKNKTFEKIFNNYGMKIKKSNIISNIIGSFKRR